MKGLVFDIQRFSLHDGPGIRTTVFLKGCPLRCYWCQNPEGRKAAPELMFTAARCALCGACAAVCPVGAHSFDSGHHNYNRALCRVCGKCATACLPKALELSGREMTVEQVLEAVRRDRIYYQKSGGGMTLSGGEPLFEPKFAAALLTACKAEGIHTAIETALCSAWSDVESLLAVSDFVMADLKHADAAAHFAGTGAPNQLILENLGRLDAAAKPYLVRLPLIPGYNDSPESVSALAEAIIGLKNSQGVELLPFHRLGEAKQAALGRPAAPRNGEERPARVEEAEAILRSRGLKVVSHASARFSGADEIEGREAWNYGARLSAIRERKLVHTELKRRQGPRDIDDWGQIPLTEPRPPFRPETFHPKGYVLGPRDCGRNFRRFLEAAPVYVDRDSSLLGGYYELFGPHATGWDLNAYWSHLAADQAKYGIIHGIDNTQHFIPDVEIGLKLGFGGLLRKIEAGRKANRGEEQQAYYDGLTEYVKGIQSWIRNHAAAAREAAGSEARAEARRNLLEQAEFNARLIVEPPASFREALQWLVWYQMAKRVYIGGGSLGCLDRALFPYYAREKAAGALDDETAVFHLACFLVKDTPYIQLGGVDLEGRDATNPVSFLFLEAAHRLRIPANLAVMVHEEMDRKLLRRAVELLFVDRMGIPRFCGQKGLVEGMLRRGFSPAEARSRVQAGCHWFGIPGREYCFNDVIKINFAKVFLVGFEELMAESGSPGRAPSVNRLWELFDAHLARAVEVTAQGIDWHLEHQHRFYPELALSLLCHGPIEKGVDASHGSLEHVNIGVDGAALATVADAFAAVEQRVEKEGLVGWTELHGALRLRWWRGERIRMLMKSVPGFGRGGTAGDRWAERIARRFAELVAAKPTPAGWRMTPGLFSWASTISMGRETGATPDGRGDGEPISFGANPNPGRLRGGDLTPTDISTAVARVQPGYGNPAPFQLDVDPGLLCGPEGVEKFEALIRAHFELGGTLINANILDREQILEACRHPEKAPDLVVRVTGFSAYFASLSDEFRKLVYERVVAMGV